MTVNPALSLLILRDFPRLKQSLYLAVHMFSYIYRGAVNACWPYLVFCNCSLFLPSGERTGITLFIGGFWVTFLSDPAGPRHAGKQTEAVIRAVCEEDEEVDLNHTTLTV